MAASDKKIQADDTVSGSTVESLIIPPLEVGKAYLIVIKGRSVGRMQELGDAPVVLGRSGEADFPVDDEAVSRQHARVERAGRDFAIVDLDSTNGLFVNNERVEQHVLQDGDRVQMGTSTILKFAYQDVVEESFQRHLYTSATRDSLVSTYNRQFFLDSLNAEFSLCFRSNMPLSLLMLDIDHFKRVNDSYGHLTGDQALREVAAVIQKSLRTEDILARYGGEEFTVILRYADAEHAFIVAERIRRGVETHVIEHERSRFGVTVSIGLATLINKCHNQPEDLLREADEFLYKAKRLGRNRTISADVPGPEEKRDHTEPASASPTGITRTLSVPTARAAGDAAEGDTVEGPPREPSPRPGGTKPKRSRNRKRRSGGRTRSPSSNRKR